MEKKEQSKEIKTIKIITRRPNGNVRVQTINDEPTMTQQQFKDQVDVNNIIAKFKKTGQITHLNASKGVYADLTQVGDYQSAMDKVVKAQEAFLTLPADLRKKFGNDPENFLKFVDDPKNDAEAVELGIKIKKEEKVDPVLEELKTLNKNISSKKSAKADE